MSCYICGEKEHWASKCPKKRKSKLNRPNLVVLLILLLSHLEIRKSEKCLWLSVMVTIEQVDIASIINTIDGILLDYMLTSHMFSE